MSASGGSGRTILRRGAIVLILLGGACCGLVATRETWLPWAGRWLDVGQPPVKSDYVLVLNGDMNSRPFVAAALAKQGLAEKVIITMVKEPSHWPESPWPREHEVVRRIQLARGVPEDRLIVLESSCDATRDEALVLHEFLRDKPAATVTVVTSDFHTRRTRWVFREVLGNRGGQLHFVSAPTDFYNAGNWWRFEESFVLYLQEFGKFGFYWMAYGPGLWYVLGTTAALGMLFVWRFRRGPTDHAETATGENRSPAQETAAHGGALKSVVSP